jgi:hypothetical protein
MGTWIRIKHHLGEGACKHCGSPLYVGDRAVLVGGDLACSNRCARKLREHDHESEMTDDPFEQTHGFDW